MDKSGKVWGETSRIFSKNNVETYRIIGKKGGKSSMHKHTFKLSSFFVERGSIAIVVEKNDYDLVDRTVLKAGESTTIKPNEHHLFEVLEDDTVCYEFYWVELDNSDIQRKNCGSI
jgi:quercetin dioxygenase-like cupin family protein